MLPMAGIKNQPLGGPTLSAICCNALPGAVANFSMELFDSLALFRIGVMRPSYGRFFVFLFLLRCIGADKIRLTGTLLLHRRYLFLEPRDMQLSLDEDIVIAVFAHEGRRRVFEPRHLWSNAVGRGQRCSNRQG